MQLILQVLVIALCGLSQPLISQTQLDNGPIPLKVIEKGTTEILEHDLDVETLRIRGTLKCPEQANPDKPIRIQANSIVVDGKFQCGDTEQPFSGQLTIAMRVGPDSTGSNTEGGIVVGMNGTLQLHGLTQKSTFTKLAQDSSAGDLTLYMTDSPAWAIGDSIIIGPTSMQWNEAERRTITHIDGSTVTLDQPLNFFHNGTQQSLNTRFQNSSGQILKLDNRAEIANISRNIKVTTLNPIDQKGGHIMVHRGGKAFLDAVELEQLGRMGEMGRYPFHWHLSGDVQGQFIKNSSIHDSYQRCVTIHGTQNALVENNVCFNHFGHGFFLEDGNETGNILRGNLGFMTKKVPEGRQLLKSDLDGQQVKRFIPSSTYWISNPDNTVVDNIASGSQGTGFWMAFDKDIHCGSIGCRHKGEDLYDSLEQIVQPAQTATREFARNVAHSTEVGITWDGAPDGNLTLNPLNPFDREIVSSHYAPPSPPVFADLLAYMNRQAGIYFRGNSAVFKNTVLADNNWSFFAAYNQKLVDSVVLGQSLLYRQLYAGKFPLGTQQPKGVLIYDGPFEINQVDFLEFPEQQILLGTSDVTAVPFGILGGANRFTNAVSGLRFDPEPFTRVAIKDKDQAPWADSSYSWSLRDLDGTLTGTAGALVVSRNPFVLDNTRCLDARDLWNATVCDETVELGSVFISAQDRYKSRFRITRVNADQTEISTPDTGTIRDEQYQNKFGVILASDTEYWVNFMDGFEEHFRPNGFTISFRAEKAQKMSPILRFKDFASSCMIPGLILLTAEQLQAGTTAGYLMEGRDLSLRLKTGSLNQNRSSFNAQIKCTK